MPWHPDRSHNELALLPPRGVTLESPRVLKSLIEARVALAELDRATHLLPNPDILLHSISLLEAQASSEIENIVTTTDELFRAAQFQGDALDPATKETLRYNHALRLGLDSIAQRPLSLNTAVDVCSAVVGSQMQVRSLPGTRIANAVRGEIVYAPPEGRDLLMSLLSNWEEFVYAEDALDPLVRMAVLHYQFEAIHPFTDGNGRTGRIINLLYLVQSGLLSRPVLYLSRAIIARKQEYYDRLLAVTTAGDWQSWIQFMVSAVLDSARSTTAKVTEIHELQRSYRQTLPAITVGARNAAFLDVLVEQPYCRVSQVMQRCDVTRPTATAWLTALTEYGLLEKAKVGRHVLYINPSYLALLSQSPSAAPIDSEP